MTVDLSPENQARVKAAAEANRARGGWGAPTEPTTIVVADLRPVEPVAEAEYLDRLHPRNRLGRWREKLGDRLEYREHHRTEARNEETTGKIIVGPKFFDLPEHAQDFVIAHELGHDLDDALLKDPKTQWVWDAPNWVDADGVELGGPTAKPGERIADAYAVAYTGGVGDATRWPAILRVAKEAQARGLPIHDDIAAMLANPPQDGEWDRSGDTPRWRQAHDTLVADALRSWKGWPSDMRIHMADELAGAKQPDSGTGKKRRAQAAALLREMREKGRANPVTLYRGSHVDATGMSAWSEDERVARGWAEKGGGTVRELAPGSVRGLRVGDYIASQKDEEEREWLVPPLAAEVLEPKEWADPPPPVGKAGETKGGKGYSSDEAFGTNTALGHAGEDAFVRIVGGRILHQEGKGAQSPLDVHYDGYGFEVKAVSTRSTAFKATPKPYEIEQKTAHAEALGVKPALAIVVIDSDNGRAHAYFRESLKGGRLSKRTGWQYLGSTDLPETKLTEALYRESLHPRDRMGQFRLVPRTRHQIAAMRTRAYEKRFGPMDPRAPVREPTTEQHDDPELLDALEAAMRTNIEHLGADVWEHFGDEPIVLVDKIGEGFFEAIADAGGRYSASALRKPGLNGEPSIMERHDRPRPPTYEVIEKHPVSGERVEVPHFGVTSSADLATVIRHEWWHYIEQRLTYEQMSEYRSLFPRIAGEHGNAGPIDGERIAREVAPNAGADQGETAAEVFAITTHPEFRADEWPPWVSEAGHAMTELIYGLAEGSR